MHLLWLLFLLALGAVLLYLGGAGLVKGASSLASRLGVSPLVVGLTVVAFGTSAPELFVSSLAALRGSTDISLGNIVGSNLANLGLVLGMSAMLRPVVVQASTFRLELPFVIGVSILLWIFAADGVVGRLDGIIFLGLFVAFLVYCYLSRHPVGEAQEKIKTTKSMAVDLALIAFGLVALVAGSEAFIRGASGLARLLGVSEFFIGLSVVAVGTSLPELATSVVAAAKGHADISVGNVVGSNLFNVLLVQGVVSTITPIPAPPSAIRFDLPVMLGEVLLLMALIFIVPRMNLARRDGAILLAYYAAYMVWIAFRG